MWAKTHARRKIRITRQKGGERNSKVGQVKTGRKADQLRGGPESKPAEGKKTPH